MVKLTITIHGISNGSRVSVERALTLDSND